MNDAKLVVTLCGATAAENALATLAATSSLMSAGASPLEAAAAFEQAERAGLEGRLHELTEAQRQLASAWINAQRAAYDKIMAGRGQTSNGPLPNSFDMRVIYRDQDASSGEKANASG